MLMPDGIIPCAPHGHVHERAAKGPIRYTCAVDVPFFVQSVGFETMRLQFGTKKKKDRKVAREFPRAFHYSLKTNKR